MRISRCRRRKEDGDEDVSGGGARRKSFIHHRPSSSVGVEGVNSAQPWENNCRFLAYLWLYVDTFTMFTQRLMNED
jgi:hypothetical protein